MRKEIIHKNNNAMKGLQAEGLDRHVVEGLDRLVVVDTVLDRLGVDIDLVLALLVVIVVTARPKDRLVMR